MWPVFVIFTIPVLAECRKTARGLLSVWRTGAVASHTCQSILRAKVGATVTCYNFSNSHGTIATNTTHIS